MEFTDLDSLLPALISIGGLPEDGLGLWIDQNNSPHGGWGGDCDVRFDRNGALRLQEVLKDADKLGRSGPVAGWEPLDCVGYTWCDQDEVDGEHSGEVCLLARRGVVRLSVQSRRSMWPPYDLTMPVDALERLIELVGKALSP